MTTSDFSQKLSRLAVITKTLACRDAGMAICLPNPSKCGLKGRAGIEDDKMILVFGKVAILYPMNAFDGLSGILALMAPIHGV